MKYLLDTNACIIILEKLSPHSPQNHYPQHMENSQKNITSQRNIAFAIAITLLLLFAKSVHRGVWITDGESPTISPDGSKIVFIIDEGHGEKLAIINTDGSQKSILLEKIADTYLRGGIQWISDDELLIFNEQQFWAINIHTNNRRLFLEGNYYLQNGSNIILSPSKNKLAFAHSNNYMHMIDLITGQEIRLEPSGYQFCGNQTFSPDERWLLYQCLNLTKFDIQAQVWLGDLSTGTSKLISTEGYVNSFSWSPDGNWIAFTDSACGFWSLGICSNIQLVPVTNMTPHFNRSRRIYVLGNITTYSSMEWSPDSKTIFYFAHMGITPNKDRRYGIRATKLFWW